MGCSDSDGEGESNDSLLNFGDFSWINKETYQNYGFGGECVGEEITYVFSLPQEEEGPATSEGGEEEGVVRGTIPCEGGQWSVDGVDFSEFPDGDIILVLTLGSNSTPPITIGKDTESPPAGTLSGNVSGHVGEGPLSLFGDCGEDDGRVGVSVGDFFTGTALCENGSWDIDVSFAGQSDGNYPIVVGFSDGAGNSADFGSTGNVVKDIVAPAVENITESRGIWTWGCSEVSCQYRFAINDRETHSFDGETYNSTTTVSASGIGTFYLHVQAVDPAGNESAVATNGPIVIDSDTTNPVVSSVEAPADASYKEGVALEFTVVFSEVVSVDTAAGVPSLGLTVGSADREARYESGSGSNRLLFSYTVSSSDNDEDGIALGADIALNGGSILDGGDNPATLSLGATLPALAEVLVDTTAPVVQNIVEADDGWIWGCSESCRYRFAVTDQASGHSFGSGPYGEAAAASPSGYGSFYLHVQAMDVAGNESAVASSGPLVLEESDTTSPTVSGVSGPSGYYVAAETVILTVHFSESVTVAGTPELVLDIGGTTGSAVYTGDGISGTDQEFTYTVADGQNGTVAVTGLTMELGESIEGPENNPAMTSGLNFTVAGVTVDTTVPVVQNIVEEAGGGWIWSCSESCEYRFAVNNQASGHVFDTEPYSGNVSAAVPSGYGTFYLHVQARDNAGNESAVASSGPLVIEAPNPEAPAVTGVTAPADDYAVAGETVVLTVSFSESVTVVGTPQLILEVGSAETRAFYTGDGSSGMGQEFTYTVANGQSGSITATNFSLGVGDSIRDDANNGIVGGFSFAVAGVNVDGAAPTRVAGFHTLPEERGYVAGEDLFILIQFSEAVVVEAGRTPMVLFHYNGNNAYDKVFDYVSGSGSDILTFRYQVQGADIPFAGFLEGFVPNEAIQGLQHIGDPAGNPAQNVVSDSVPALQTALVRPAIITRIDPVRGEQTITDIFYGTYRPLLIDVTFNREVTAGGDPQLTVSFSYTESDGSTVVESRAAEYLGEESSGAVHRFRFTPEEGDFFGASLRGQIDLGRPGAEFNDRFQVGVSTTSGDITFASANLHYSNFSPEINNYIEEDDTPTMSYSNRFGCPADYACQFRHVINQTENYQLPESVPYGDFVNGLQFPVAQNSGNGPHYVHIQARTRSFYPSPMRSYRFVMDTNAPAFMGEVEVPTGAYPSGDTLEFVVRYDENLVTAPNNVARLTLTMSDGSTRSLPSSPVSSVDSTSTLGEDFVTFQYRIADDDPEGSVTVGDSLEFVPGKFLRDVAGHLAQTAPLPLPATMDLSIVARPRVLSAALVGTETLYARGDTVEIDVTFDQEVRVPLSQSSSSFFYTNLTNSIFGQFFNFSGTEGALGTTLRFSLTIGSNDNVDTSLGEGFQLTQVTNSANRFENAQGVKVSSTLPVPLAVTGSELATFDGIFPQMAITSPEDITSANVGDYRLVGDLRRGGCGSHGHRGGGRARGSHHLRRQQLVRNL